MLHPSYTDLIEAVNKDVEEGEANTVNSRYSIVMAAAKRAREIIDGSEPMVIVKGVYYIIINFPPFYSIRIKGKLVFLLCLRA